MLYGNLIDFSKKVNFNDRPSSTTRSQVGVMSDTWRMSYNHVRECYILERSKVATYISNGL